MRLTLRVVRSPQDIFPASRALEAGSLRIGRGDQNDWILPDPQQHLSRQHCILELHGDHWMLRDESTYGTFVNADVQPVGQSQPRVMRDGDRLRLGPYELEVRITDDRTVTRGLTELVAEARLDSPDRDTVPIDPFQRRGR